MSEPTPPAAAPRKKENVLKRKIGPLPTWAWVAIVAGIILAYAYWKNRTSAQNTPADTGATAGAGQVPQFVNQTYSAPEPPEPPEPQPPAGPPRRRDKDHLPPDDDDMSRKPRPGPVDQGEGPPTRKTTGPPRRRLPPHERGRNRRRRREMA